MGVNNKKGMMKTPRGKAVPVIAFIRTLLIVQAVAACTVATDDLAALRKKAEAGDVIVREKRDLITRGLTLTQLKKGQEMVAEIWERIKKRKATGAE